MEKKSFIVAAILVILYFLSFFLVNLSKKLEPRGPLPLITIPTCKEQYTVAGIFENGDIICYNDLELLVLREGHETKLETFEKTRMPYYIGTVGNNILKADEQTLTISHIEDNSKMTPIHILKLAKTETVVSHFAVQEDHITYLYLTILKEVNKPTENRTAIYLITIDTSTQIQLKKRVELLRMEKIVSVIGKQSLPIIVTTEMFPFLEHRIQVYKLADTLKSVTPSCSQIENFIDRNNFNAVQLNECKSMPNGWYSITDKGEYIKTLKDPLPNCLVIEQEYSLCIDNENVLNDRATSKRIVLPLTIEHYSAIVQRYSTTISKNVYNCNDFGESSQITLRVCIPIL